ncbi:MAG: hypothetical protein UX16_C0016G0003 [Parcubacteria group bacterium GW2011_GWB1_45_7]|nr:MAG: hypothetical protein UX16_C0016G0003 [Parcubacteria group bacterium GW2011_GWB1_45_7]
MSERTQVDLSTESVFRALLLVLAFILFYLLSDIAIIFIFAIVIASGVQPFVSWMEQRRVPRIASVLVLYLGIFLVGAVFSSLVVPSMVSDLSQLTSYLPKLTTQIAGSLDAARQGAPQYFDFVGEIQNIVEILSGYLQQFSQSALNVLVGAFGGIVSFIAVVVISFYLAIMKNGIEGLLEAIIPERYETYIVNLWRRVEHKVGLWLQGQLLLALIIGFLVYIGLSLFHIKFALLFAIIAMVLEIVPVAGPVLSAIPAIFMAFLQSPMLGFWIFIMYVVVQQLESHILVPIVIGKTTGMNPIVVILAILIGFQLAGIPGALVGVPVATIIVEIVDDMVKLKSSRKAV